MADVEIERAPPQAQATIANLIQLYTHDFSDFWVGQDRGDVGEDGLFEAYDYLDSYWSGDPRRIPLLIRASGRIAGFALLNDHAHSGRALDWSMAEFFVLRKYRGGGVGRSATHRIFDLYPGAWEAAVARANTPALAFWRRAIGDHPKARAIEELDVHTEDWNGPILRFVIDG